MSGFLRKTVLPIVLLLGSSPAFSAEFNVSIDIPRLDVAEYHRPYVAIWIAEESNQVAANMMVLYDVDMAENEGAKWLKDLRQWWRRSGRGLDMPVDGIVGATRAQGQHDFDFADKVNDLPAGQYRLVVEAVREVGGREMVEIPFQWPAGESQHLTARGEVELGNVSLMLAP